MGDNYFLLTNLLSEDERKVITSIASHIERGEKRVGIQQIASENFLSTTSIVKMCKRLGFDGYSELYYHLSRQLASSEEKKPEDLKSLILDHPLLCITYGAPQRKSVHDRRGLFQYCWDIYHAPTGNLWL